MLLKINTLNGLILKLKSELYMIRRHTFLLGSGSDFLITYCYNWSVFQCLTHSLGFFLNTQYGASNRHKSEHTYV